MKRRISIVIITTLILTSLMVGCQRNTPHISYPTTTRTPYTTPVVSEQVVIPDHIQSIFEKYKQVTAENGFGFRIISGNVLKIGDASYEFEFKSDSSIALGVSFNIFNDQAAKSYSVIFSTRYNDLAKEFITATFMVTGNSDFQTAKDTMQNMVNSYREGAYSDTVESGDYLIFLAPLMGDYILEVKHMDEIIPEINKSEYAPVDYETALAGEMNDGMKVILKGEVLENTFEDTLHLGEKQNFTKVKASDDNVYIFYYDYSWMPVQFVVGQTYIFYGKISKLSTGDIPLLYLSSFEIESVEGIGN